MSNVDPVEVAQRIGSAGMKVYGPTDSEVQAMARVVLAAEEWRAAREADFDGTVDARTDPDEFTRRSNRCDAADDALAAVLRGER